jgi:hypothetical protein
MKKTMKYLYLTVLAGCLIFPAKAQQPAKIDSSSVNREMTLEKEYNPTIRDAVKINQLPELREPQAPKSKVEFSNYAVPYEIRSGLNLLNPQSFLSDLNYSKYKGYATAGISTLLDINGDLGYQILNSKKDFLSLFASHRSSNSNVTNLQIDTTQKFKINDNWIGLNFLHKFDKVKLNIDAKYTYSAFDYSGLSSAFASGIIMEEPYLTMNAFPNQVNNLFEIHAGVLSDEASVKNYKINATYTRYGQEYMLTTIESGRKENRILIDGDFHTKFNSTMGLGLAGGLKNYSYSLPNRFKGLDDLVSEYWGNSNYSVLSLNPYFYFEGDNWDLLLGGKIDFEFGGSKKGIAAPTIRFNYYPTDQFLFYVIADGGRKDNSNYNTFYENRYVNPVFKIWDSRTFLDGTAGIKFLPIRNLSVDIFGGYKMTLDEHFYLYSTIYPDADGLAGTTLIPDYQDANTLKGGADIKYILQDVFEIDLKGVYYNWDITTKPEVFFSEEYLQAWHKPNFVADLNAAYRLSAIPLRFNLAYHGEFGRKTTPPINSLNFDMKDINDLSLKATYSVNKFFSAYLSTNNLLFQKQDIWYGYPAQNFNIMAGISVLF